MHHTRRQPFTVALLGIASLLLGSPGRAQTPAGVAEYLVPFDEDVFAYTTARVTNATIGATSTSRSQTDVTAWSNSVTVYYDHWENGYGLDALTLTGADEVYTIGAGDTLSFLSTAVPRPRTGADGNTYVGAAGACVGQLGPTGASNGTDYCYDGRDRFVTVGGATTVTRGGWLAATDIHASVGEEVYPLAPQLIKYILPFGESTTRVDYNRVVVVIQATEDDTTLRIDFNGDGFYDSFNTENGYRTTRADPTDATFVTLDRGESYVLDRDSDGIGGTLNAGVVMLGDKTLQVEFFYGQNPSTYNTRAVAAYPRGFWSDEYYAPADGAPGGADTDVTLYNPNASTLTIAWQTTAGSGSFTMAPSETAFFQAKTGGYIPDGSALYLKGSDAFWGISDIDTNSSQWDWSYSLVPSYLLRSEQFVSKAPGNVPIQNPPGANGRGLGIFVTPIQDNTTFFVDQDGNGTADTTFEVIRGATTVTPTGSGYRANRLQSLYITDDDGDLTGARIWATGPFAMAYGENPQRTADNQGVDLGYTVLPSPDDWMDLALTVDKATNPIIVSTVAGATPVTYTLTVDSHLFNLTTIDVVDTLPANWEYIDDSSTITFPNLTQLTGDAADPTTVALPNLTWSTAKLGSMLPNQRITITFQARTTAAFASGDLTQNNVQATGTRSVGAVTQTFTARDFAFNTYLDSAVNNMTVDKSTGAADPVSPGDTIPYTVKVSNPGSATLTGVSIFDQLPPGVTYVAGSSFYTCGTPAPRTYIDNFGAIAYNNSNGTSSWTAKPWVETDPAGGGAATGAVLVTGGQLRLREPFNVRDEFTAQSYANSNGSVSWAGDWTETDLHGTGTTGPSGGYVLATGAALQLRALASTVIDDFSGGFSTDSTDVGGSNDWSDASWNENDTGGAGTGSGYIRTGNGALNFDGSDAATIPASPVGSTITRSMNLTAATSAVLTFDFSKANLENDDDVQLQLSSDGSTFTTIATYDNTVAAGAKSHDITDYISATTTIRFRISSGFRNNNDEAYFDNLTVSYFRPEAGGASVRRSANIAGATAATLTFSYTGANLSATAPADSVVIEASSDGTSFTTLETFTSTTANGVKSYNLVTPTNYASATTTIRFRVTGGFTTNETVSIDNVDITYTPTQPAVQRSANLTGATAASLTLTIGSGGLAPGDTVVLEASKSPSGPFTTLATSDGGAAFSPALSADNLLPYVSADTTIRFRITSGFAPAATKYFTIDGVTITYTSPPGAAASAPPTMVPTSAGCNIAAGGAATLTFSVTVDNPFPAGQTEILNVATAIATQIPLPISDDALNHVSNPSALSATVGDRVWLDTDGDGALDVGEAGIAGVELTLKDEFGTPLQVTTTDSQGRYTFVGVPPGSGYFVQVTGGLPGGLTQTTDGRTDNRTSAFTLTPGQDYVTADLGFRASAGTATIGDLVWSDADGDGVRGAGEPGLAGVTLELLEDTNGDGVGDINPKECFGVIRPEPPPYAACTTVTAADGSYLFTGIVANGSRDYSVSVNPAQPALTAYAATTPVFAGFANVPALAGYVTADFGFQQQSSGTTFSITDRVWLDNGVGSGGIASNGLQDGTEAGISGVTVALLDGGGNIIATTTTGANGNFQFTGVPAGQNYRWQVTDQFNVLNGFFGTTASALAGQYQMSGNLTGNLDYTTTTVPNIPHFGYNVTRAIGDTVFVDSGAGGGTAGNGIQDGTEAGINGVVVQLFLDRDNDGVFEPTGADGPAVATLTTDANGHYLFSGLPDGRYWVSIDNTQSALTGYTTLTTGDTETGSAGHQRVVNLSGASDLGIDYGYQAATSYALSGRLWNDVNANGADNSEPGFAGVTLEVVRNGVVIGTTTTDGSGNYSFAGLPGGSDYTVRITDVNGVLSGYSTTFERTELTGPTFNGQETVTALSADVSNINFGFYRPVPVPVSLAWFRATTGRHGVLVEWETSVEAGNVGFNVVGETGKTKELLNAEIIPAQAVSALKPSSYAFETPAGPTRFWLEEIDLEGNVRRHGPFGLDRQAGELDRVEKVDWVAVNRESAARLAERNMLLAANDRLSALGMRLLVDRDGMYRVTYEALLAAGLDLANVPVGNLLLTNRGRAVPVSFGTSGGASKGFGPGSYLVFWGEAPKSQYTAQNVYRLRIGAPGSARTMVVDTRGVDFSTRPTTTYTETVKVDRNAGYSFSSPTQDPWYDKRLLAYTTPVQASMTLDLADVVPGDGKLNVGLWGSTDWPGSPDHHVVVRWNGQTVTDRFFDGITSLPLEIPLSGSQLNSGANQLEIALPGDSGVAYELVMLDTYSVSYPRLLKARGDVLAFGARQGQLAVEGLTSPDVHVFRKPVDTDEVQQIVGGIVEPWAGGYRVRFPASESVTKGLDQYQVTTGAAFLSPQIEPGRPGVDLGSTDEANLLVVSHPDFLSAVAPLVDARRASGVSVRVVDVESVFEQFSGGVVDPAAIKEMVQQASRRWGIRSVLLVGGDSYDYLDHLALGSKSFVPTLYVATDPVIVRFAPADALFGDLDGDGVPEIAVGRLPVRTSAELATVVAKTLAWTSASSAVLAADLADGGLSFSTLSDSIGTKLPKKLPVTRAYMETLGAAGARTILQDGMNQGNAFVSYFGHSSYTRWSFGGLFTSADAAILTNVGRPLVVSQFGCWNNYFVEPTYDTLGHALLLSGDRGAAITLGTATLSEVSSESILGPILIERLFVRGKTIGQALVEAKAEVARIAPNRADIQVGMTLLGDPELVLLP